ncbi:MAG TPA: hypothetical protein VD995_26855 [Azospirillum sp.]|nr:hypothetical protein [Azospirillum sp.]
MLRTLVLSFALAAGGAGVALAQGQTTRAEVANDTANPVKYRVCAFAMCTEWQVLMPYQHGMRMVLKADEYMVDVGYAEVGNGGSGCRLSFEAGPVLRVRVSGQAPTLNCLKI